MCRSFKATHKKQESYKFIMELYEDAADYEILSERNLISSYDF